jgi:hypothetical protein
VYAWPPRRARRQRKARLRRRSSRNKVVVG